MSRHLAWFSSAVVMLAVSAPLQALNYEVGGCKTGSGYVNFTTISAAVVGVPAGATILVCPGVYPEQVTITQPLTLKGIASGNANRAVITINPNGSLAPNASDLAGAPVYAQVLVQNVSPAGPVNIVGITVDGAGANPESPGKGP
jgi:pectin methylesterase-like acyl-CoA thioesterase